MRHRESLPDRVCNLPLTTGRSVVGSWRKLRTCNPMNKSTEGRNFVVRKGPQLPKAIVVCPKRCALTIWPVLAVLILATLASPVRALNISVTYDTTVTSQPNAAQIESAFAAAVQTFEDLYTNAITVNITVFYQSGIGLGQSSTSFTGNPSYSD